MPYATHKCSKLTPNPIKSRESKDRRMKRPVNAIAIVSVLSSAARQMCRACYQKLPGIEIRSGRSSSGMSASFSLTLPPSVRMTTETHAAYASLMAHAMHVSLIFATTALCPWFAHHALANTSLSLTPSASMARTLVTCSWADLVSPFVIARAFFVGEDRDELGREMRPDWRPQS